MKNVILRFSLIAAWRRVKYVRSLLVLTPLVLFAFSLQAQNVNVSGKVTSLEDSEPLPGVNVHVKGTTTGAITDVDGNYSLQAPADGTLVFSYVGYTSEEIPINSRSVINVSLALDIQTLGEIVVVGYGTQRKEAVTGSVASIEGDILRDVPAADVTQSLQGRIPGVVMTQTNTKPGATMQIRIRGTRSLSTSKYSGQNDPLVVLDGIPFGGSINDIDPNSIKSIDILKDASATAIYGSRGSNGVILVTTHRGKKGQEARISYNAYYGMKKAIKYPMMSGPEFARMREIALETGGGYQASAMEQNDNANTDWQELFYRDGRVNSHDINISKGSENGSYVFGFGYLNDEAVVPTQGYDRFTMRATIDQEIGEYLRFGLSSNNSYGISNGNQVGIGAALANSPLISPYDENGELRRSTRVSSQDDAHMVWTPERLESLEDLWISESKTFGTYNNIYGEVEVPWVKGLRYRLNVGLNYRQARGGDFTGRGINNPTDENAPSSAAVSNSLRTGWALENLLSYDRTLGDKHEINAVALFSAEQNSWERSRFAVLDFPSDHFQFRDLSFAQGERTINPDDQQYWVTGLVSWMGRVMYSYDSRYMLTATLRSDGSSRLAPGHQWHTYPAISAGWNIARESFMQNIAPIDMLKLRVGYGETSNQAVDPYTTAGLLDTRQYNFGDNGDQSYATGYYVSELPNENLGWEFTETWNFGMDFGLFSGRLTGTIEYYQQHTKDILLSVDLPQTTGVSSYIENIGETENKGLEISLNGVILQNVNGFTWEAGINWFTNKNKLLSLTSGQERNEGNSWFVGYPINSVYDVKKIGIWQEDDPYLDILEPGGNVGMIKVEYTGEYNSDGTPVREIGPDDRQVIEIDPEFQGGFNTRLAYKGFDLSMIGSFQRGGTLYSALYGSTGYLNLMSGRSNNVKVDYWTPDNTDAKYPLPGGVSSADNPRHGSTRGYFDASYLKVRTISLGYNFAQAPWMERAGFSQLRLYATVQDPFVMFSPYHRESGMDPQPNSYGDENQAVTGQFPERIPIVASNTPATRNYLIGLNLTF